jgi:hypothetical protein
MKSASPAPPLRLRDDPRSPSALRAELLRAAKEGTGYDAAAGLARFEAACGAGACSPPGQGAPSAGAGAGSPPGHGAPLPGAGLVHGALSGAMAKGLALGLGIIGLAGAAALLAPASPPGGGAPPAATATMVVAAPPAAESAEPPMHAEPPVEAEPPIQSEPSSEREILVGDPAMVKEPPAGLPAVKPYEPSGAAGAAASGASSVSVARRGSAATAEPRGTPASGASSGGAPATTSGPLAAGSAPAGASSSDALADETAHLARLRALEKSDPEKALSSATDGDRRFGTGIFAEEREAIAIAALVQLGRKAETRARADAFLRAHPGSHLSERVRRITAGAKAP